LERYKLSLLTSGRCNQVELQEGHFSKTNLGTDTNWSFMSEWE